MTDNRPQPIARSELRSILDLSVDPFSAEELIRGALQEAGREPDCDEIPVGAVAWIAARLPQGVAGRRARRRLQPFTEGQTESDAAPEPSSALQQDVPAPSTAEAREPGAERESQEAAPVDEPPAQPRREASRPAQEGLLQAQEVSIPVQERSLPAQEILEASLDQVDDGRESSTRLNRRWLVAAVLIVALLGLAIVWFTGSDESGSTEEGRDSPAEEPAGEPEKLPTEPESNLPPYDAAVREMVVAVHEGRDLFDVVDSSLIELVSTEEFVARRRQWAERQLDINRLYGEELALQTIGLLPDGFHYPQFFQDSLSEPVAQFFDEETGHVVRTKDGLPVGLSLPAVPPRPRELKGAAPVELQAALGRLDDEPGEKPAGSGDAPEEDAEAKDDGDDTAEPDSGEKEGDEPSDEAEKDRQIEIPPVPAPFPFRETIYALQYRYFSLADESDVEIRSPVGNDHALAMMALLQGDAFAIWVAAQNPDRDFWAPGGADLIDEIEARLDASGSLVGTPDFLKRVAKFPELEGARWVHARLRGDATHHSQLFDAFPGSTQVIYSRGPTGSDPVEPIEVTLPLERMGIPANDQVYEGSLGELGIRAWLELVGLQRDASSITSGWDGDELWCFAVGRKALVINASLWENEAAAAAFEDAVRLLYVQRYGPVHHYQSRVLRQGRRVVWMEGVLPSKQTTSVLEDIAGQLGD